MICEKTLPNGWRFGKITYFCEVQLGKMLQPEPKNENDVLKPYLRSANLAWHGVDTRDVKKMWFSQYELEKYRLQKNDILVSEGGDVGRTSLWSNNGEMYIQNAINRIRCLTNKQSPKFIYYWFYYLKNSGYIDILCNSSTISHYTAEKVKATQIVVPSIKEQESIVSFLDKKTSAIDALIEKKQKLIQLLEEKRSALISQVVTKGLDPNLPMKDSGINWLGKIPDCWDLKRIKFYVRSINKKIHYENTKLPYIGLENIESWTGKKIEDNSVTSEGVVCCFEAKDVLFGKLRPYLAKTYLAKDDGTCSTEFLVFRPCAYVDPEYLQYFLLSPKFINTVNASTYGAKMPRANWEFIANLYLACPSLLVQKQIIQFLNDETVKIDLIKTKIKDAIERLKEYRAALITNAVTGKIALTAEKDKRFAYE